MDRLGRSLKHLLDVLHQLAALRPAFVSLNEGIDATTPSGRLQMHLLGAFAEFERSRISERVRAGLARARREGKRLGRPPRRISVRELESVAALSNRAAARELRVSASHVHRARKRLRCNLTPNAASECRPSRAAKGVEPRPRRTRPSE